MGLDLSQRQLGDVAQEGFEALVFAYPSLNLREQRLRDMNGTSLALDLEGQVMGRVALTRVAVTAGAAAFSAEGDQAGGDQRAVEFELLDARVQMAADQGGVFGNGHWVAEQLDCAGISDTYYSVSEKASIKSGAKKFLGTAKVTK
jgi:hypothetical protein